MSWTDYFPVFTDDLVEKFKDTASLEDRGLLKEMFAGKVVGPPDSSRHLLCLTLSPALPPPPKSSSVLSPVTNWLTQEKNLPVEASMLLRSTALRLAAERPGVRLRVYLDPVWAESGQALVNAGCQIVLMARPSDGPNPASLWRFLAMESGVPVTFLSLADLGQVDNFIERTDALRSSGLKMWRTPMDRRLNYRPIDPDRFGLLEFQTVLDLLHAFAWHIQKAPDFSKQVGADQMEKCPLFCKHSNRQVSWDRPDSAEFFLMSVIYPRAVFDGVLSLIEQDDQHSRWQLLDIEYVTWANSASELILVQPLHSGLLVRPVNLKESTLVAAMFERIILENRYPEYFEAWQQAAVPLNDNDPSKTTDTPVAALELEPSKRQIL